MSKKDITFGSFNLYNLQLPGEALYSTSTPYTQAEYDAKIAWSAQKLKQLDADVIAFQELWSPQALRDIFDAAGLTDRYALTFLRNSGWYNIAVAAAVRKPWTVTRKKLHKRFPNELVLDKPQDTEETVAGDRDDDGVTVVASEFSRSVMELDIALDGENAVPPITVYCCHLKSKAPARLIGMPRRTKPYASSIGSALSTIRRTAEATGLRILLDKRMKDNDDAVVVIGDLNDGTLSNTLNIITAQPSYRLSVHSRAGRRSDKGLYMAAHLDQLRSFRDVNFSHSYGNVPDILDHVLVSDAFYDAAAVRKWSFADMQIFTDDMQTHERGGAASDHGIVRVKFDWNPNRET